MRAAEAEGWIDWLRTGPRRLQGVYSPGTAPPDDHDARTIAAHVWAVGRATRQEIVKATGIEIGNVDTAIATAVATVGLNPVVQAHREVSSQARSGRLGSSLPSSVNGT